MTTAPIYLDHNATTPVDPKVADTVEPWLRAEFGNPSSSHWYGRRARAAVEGAREQVAALLSARPEEIFFTGSATESNNLALRGVARALRSKGRHLVVSAVEHPSVSQPCRRLEADGWEVSVVPVDGHGRVDPGEVERALRHDTVLVSIMHGNNETGTLQPVEEIARIARKGGVLVHCDAAQSAGKVPLNVEALGADLLTLAGHKFNAPKGIGALYVRKGTSIEPLLVGAGQEQGLRPGTENVPWIVGLGKAATLAERSVLSDAGRMRKLRDHLHEQLRQAIPGLLLNGHLEQRLPNTLNVSFPGVSGRELLGAVGDILVASVGSACHEGKEGVSGVLGAMGIDAQRAAGAVRLSLGRSTTAEEVDRAAEALVQAWRGLGEG